MSELIVDFDGGYSDYEIENGNGILSPNGNPGNCADGELGGRRSQVIVKIILPSPSLVHSIQYDWWKGTEAPCSAVRFVLAYLSDGTSVVIYSNQGLDPNKLAQTWYTDTVESININGIVSIHVSIINNYQFAGCDLSYDYDNSYRALLDNIRINYTEIEKPNHSGPSDSPFSCETDDSYTSAEPVSLRLGEKREQVTDLDINTPSGKLNFTRSYRQSQQDALVTMGAGWMHNHIISLDTTSIANKIIIRTPKGGGAHFTKDDNSNNLYNGDSGSNSYINVVGAGTHMMVAPDQSTYTFVNNKIATHTDTNGEILTYTYYTTGHVHEEKLQKVSDAYGNELRFTYIDDVNSFDDGQLWRVGDHTVPDFGDPNDLEASTPDGRYVEYSYIQERLDGQVVTDPKVLLHTVKDVRGKVWTYDYYGQVVGEDDSQFANYLIRYTSPQTDTTGNGVTDGQIIRKDVQYSSTTSNSFQIMQSLGKSPTGDFLKVVDYDFQLDAVNGDVTAETIAGKTTTHTFESGVYKSRQDPGGNVSSRDPNTDTNYRPQSQTDANGNVTAMDWRTDGKVLNSVTDADNNTTSFVYDSEDRLKNLTNPEGQFIVYDYDDPDAPRQPTVITTYDQQGGALLRQQEFDYDSNGRTIEERLINPDDGVTPLRRTTRSYYTSGNGAGLLHTLTTVDERDASNSQSTTYTYDAVGRVVKTHKNSLLGTCQFSYTVYDPAGNIVATVCSLNNLTIPTTQAEARAMYDASDANKKYNRVTLHSYDALGRRVSTTTNAGMVIEQTTLTVYDALDRVVRTISNYVSDTSILNPYTADHSAFDHGEDDDENLVTDTHYNERGMTSKQVDPLGNVTLYGYDDAGRLVKTIQNASQPSYNNTYTEIIDGGTTHSPDPTLGSYVPVATADQDLVITQDYDPVGNQVRQVDALGRVTFTVYDELNRPIKVVRNARSAATIALDVGDPNYSAGNDPRSESYVPSDLPDHDHIELTEYGTSGQVIRTMQLANKVPTGIEYWRLMLQGYDDLNRPVKAVRTACDVFYGDSVFDCVSPQGYNKDLSDYVPSNDADRDLVTTTAYDNAGQVKYTTDVNGNATWMKYDGLGRQVKTIRNAQGTMSDNGPNDPRGDTYVPSTDPDKDIVSRTTYDTDGRVQSTEDVTRRISRNVYDAQGRLYRTIQNYVEQGTTTPDQWHWNGNNWQYSDTDTTLIEHRSDPIDHPNNFDQNIITETHYDNQGRAFETMDVRGNVTRTVFSDTGRVLKTIRNYVTQGSSDPQNWYWNGSDWQYSDTDTTLIEHRSDPANAPDRYDQNLITENSYDLPGRIVETRHPDGMVTRSVYDAAGRRVKSINNYMPQNGTDPGEWFWSDINSQWQQSETDGTPIEHYSDPTNHPDNFDQNLITQTIYDKAGQVVMTIDPRGTRTAMTYDNAGRRVAMTSAVGTSLETTTYTVYNKAGDTLRIIQNYVPLYDYKGDVISPDEIDDNGGWRFSFVLKDNGALQDQNLITDYRLDDLGRPRRIDDPISSMYDWTTHGDTARYISYYKDGQVKSMTDQEGMNTQYRYDELRRRTLVVQGYDATSDPETWAWNGTDWEEN